MSRPIDADALIPDYSRRISVRNSQFEIIIKAYVSMEQIHNAPTIEPDRKTGKWMHTDIEPDEKDHYPLGWMPWYCSECGMGVGKHQTTFCPNCGAKMEGEG